MLSSSLRHGNVSPESILMLACRSVVVVLPLTSRLSGGGGDGGGRRRAGVTVERAPRIQQGHKPNDCRDNDKPAHVRVFVHDALSVVSVGNTADPSGVVKL